MNTSTELRESGRSGLANSVLGTRNLMIIAALAVAGAIIVVPLTYLGLVLTVTPDGLIWSACLMGVWVIPYMLPLALLRRPGASYVAALIIGVISMFTTPQSYTAIFGNLIGAALIEIPLMVMLYRKWKWWAFSISGLVFSLFNGSLYAVVQQVQVTAQEQFLIVLLSVISGQIGVFVTLLLARALHRAGIGAK